MQTIISRVAMALTCEMALICEMALTCEMALPYSMHHVDKRGSKLIYTFADIQQVVDCLPDIAEKRKKHYTGERNEYRSRTDDW